MKQVFNKHSRIIQGLMRLDGVSIDELYELIKFDLDHGINTFDLADIYGCGSSEEKLGEVMKLHPELRSKMFIQSKCGIILDPDNTYYDSSYEHLLQGVKDSLNRCCIDYFDSYLIHRPDVLMDLDEVKNAYQKIIDLGLVKNFGVSNFPSNGLRMFKENGIDIKTNQLQLGLGHLNLVSEVLNCNIDNHEGTMHASDLYFYMKKEKMELQCWSPFQYAHFEGSIFQHEKMAPAMKVVKEMANKYHVSMCGLLTAFLLRLGDNVTIITGSTKKEHVKECLEGLDIDLSRKDWYRLYSCTGNLLP